MLNCPQVNATRPHLWLVNTGSGNGLVKSCHKWLPEPMLTKFLTSLTAYGVTRPQWFQMNSIWQGLQHCWIASLSVLQNPSPELLLKLPGGSRFPWQADDFMKPVLEEDALLTFGKTAWHGKSKCSVIMAVDMLLFHCGGYGNWVADHFDGLVQDCNDSSLLAVELPQSCYKASAYFYKFAHMIH